MFTTAGSSNTEIRGLCAVVEVLLNSIKEKCKSCPFMDSTMLILANVFFEKVITTLRNEYFSTRNRELCVVFCICDFTTLLIKLG